jgi:ABC-type transport system substrate-binding protein
LGAVVVVVPRDAASYVEDVLLSREFEAAIAEIDYGADPDSYAFWHSSQVQPPGRNVAGYQDAELDDKLERARQTTAVDRRQELYAEFTDVFLEGAPSVAVYHDTANYAQRATLHGFETTVLFSPTSRFHNVHEWYLNTRTVD